MHLSRHVGMKYTSVVSFVFVSCLLQMLCDIVRSSISHFLIGSVGVAGITSAPRQVAGWFLWHFERCADIDSGSAPKKVVTCRFVTALFPYSLGFGVRACKADL